VSQWEHEQIFKYPEIEIFIEKLKKLIREKPESGLPDPILLADREKNLPCLKRSVNISLFPERYAIGYSHITATYLWNGNDIAIIRIDYS
jgi:hypothetical protein